MRKTVDSSSGNGKHSKVDFCKDIHPKLDIGSVVAGILGIPIPKIKKVAGHLEVVSFVTGSYCKLQEQKKHGANNIFVKMSDAARPLFQCVEKIVELAMNTYVDVKDLMIDTYMNYQVAKLNEIQGGIPLEYRVKQHVEKLGEKHDWSLQAERQFETVFWHYIGKNGQYDEETGFKIISPEYTSMHFDEGKIETQIGQSFSRLKKILDPVQEEIAEILSSSPLIEQYIKQGIVPSDDDFNKIMSESVSKLAEALASETNGNTSPQMDREKRSQQVVGRTTFQEVSSIMQDAQMLAMIFQKPEIANGISTVRVSIERFTEGLVGLNNSNNFLHNFTASLSLFTGVAGIVSGLFSFFSNTASALEKISKQLNQISQQLDCVMKNQQKMMDILFLNSKQITEMQGQIRRFAASTRQQLDFIATQDLIQATHNIQRFYKGASVTNTTQIDLSGWVRTLQTWLLDPQHLCSRQMNGSLLNWAEQAPAKESVKILSSELNKLAVKSDDLTPLNFVGFVIGQLRYKGIDLPDEFNELPPLLLFGKTLAAFQWGLTKLIQANQQAFEQVSTELNQVVKNYKAFISYIKKNEQVVFDRLMLLYQSDLKSIKVRLAEFIERYIDKTDKPFREVQDDAYSSILLLHCGTVNDMINSEVFTQVERDAFFDLLYTAEENRLLLYLLSQWSGVYVREAMALKSGGDILNQTINFFDEASLIDEYFSNKNLYKLIPYWIENCLYEPIIALFARVKQYTPHQILHSCSSASIRTVFENTYKELIEKKEHKVNAEFQVIISHFLSDKMSADLRNTFAYYAACCDGNDILSAKLKSYVNPQLLLWITAIFGRFEVFKTVELPAGFSYVEKIQSVRFFGICNVYNGIHHFHNKEIYTDLIHNFSKSHHFESLVNYSSLTNPLMIAAKWNRIDVVHGLIDESRKGINVGFAEKDPKGNTAAQIAEQYGHIEIAELLRAHEKLVNHYGETDAFRFIWLPKPALVSLYQQTTHEALMHCIEKCGELASQIADIVPLNGIQEERCLSENILPTQDTVSLSLDETTDTEDEEELNNATQKFCEQNGVAFSSAFWCKPNNATVGVRELSRGIFQEAKSISFIHQLKNDRGQNSVKSSKEKISVQLNKNSSIEISATMKRLV